MQHVGEPVLSQIAVATRGAAEKASAPRVKHAARQWASGGVVLRPGHIGEIGHWRIAPAPIGMRTLYVSARGVAVRPKRLFNLSYTGVIAAQPGRVVNRTAVVGEYAQAGTNLTMFVPDDIWVTANCKETQLDLSGRGRRRRSRSTLTRTTI